MQSIHITRVLSTWDLKGSCELKQLVWTLSRSTPWAEHQDMTFCPTFVRAWQFGYELQG